MSPLTPEDDDSALEVLWRFAKGQFILALVLIAVIAAAQHQMIIPGRVQAASKFFDPSAAVAAPGTDGSGAVMTHDVVDRAGQPHRRWRRTVHGWEDASKWIVPSSATPGTMTMRGWIARSSANRSPSLRWIGRIVGNPAVAAALQIAAIYGLWRASRHFGRAALIGDPQGTPTT